MAASVAPRAAAVTFGQLLSENLLHGAGGERGSRASSALAACGSARPRSSATAAAIRSENSPSAVTTVIVRDPFFPG